MDRKTRIVSIVCVILAALLCLCGCEAKQTAASHTATSAAVDLSNAEKLGEGDRQFYFTVTFPDSTAVSFTAFVKSYGLGAAQVDGAVGFSAVLRLVGGVTVA